MTNHDHDDANEVYMATCPKQSECYAIQRRCVGGGGGLEATQSANVSETVAIVLKN